MNGRTVCLVFAALLLRFAAGGAVTVVPLETDWRFSLDGGAARAVTVPHDWSIEAAPSPENPSGAYGGYYRGGIGRYERTLVFDEADLDSALELVFEGAYRSAEISMNGRRIAKGDDYGFVPFRVPLGRNNLHTGTNTLAVVVGNTDQPNCRWYSGSGLTRSVRLEKRTGEWIVPWSVSVRTLSLAPAEVEIACEITNALTHAVRPFTDRFTIENAVMWTPETPVLYTREILGEKIRFGIRTLEWGADGLRLNGAPIKLHGGCIHHDHGPLGAVGLAEAERRKVRQLKKAGFNAVRIGCNPFPEVFFDVCDEEGLLVIDDLFDFWVDGKTKGDFSREFPAQWEAALGTVVRRDRVHPSVAMWSVGNEILERTSEGAVVQSAKMVALCHALDPTRPVTSALCTWGYEPEWLAEDALAATLDIVGYNYAEKYIDADHVRRPERIIVLTETYARDATTVWKLVKAHPFVIGEFVWSAMDYLGEAMIGRTFYEGTEVPGEHFKVKDAFPWHGAVCGDIDLTGLRRPISHLRETLWNENAPTFLAVREPDGWKGRIDASDEWSVWPTRESWNYEGWEGKPVAVEVYSRAASVRLTLNGRLVGEKAVDDCFTAVFAVDYEPGRLVAEGIDDAGAVKDRAELRTAGDPADIRFTHEIIGDYDWITAEVVDGNGVICPDAAVEVTFPGEVIATCSADMKDMIPASSPIRRTFRGRALGVCRASHID